VVDRQQLDLVIGDAGLYAGGHQGVGLCGAVLARRLGDPPADVLGDVAVPVQRAVAARWRRGWRERRQHGVQLGQGPARAVHVAGSERDRRRRLVLHDPGLVVEGAG
jgi:hypothetical protein